MIRYCGAVVSLTMHLVKHYNADVTFLSTCQGITGYHDDSRTATAIKESLPADISARVTVDCDFHTPDELMERLRTFDWVVATRMHFAILAFGVGTPVLPIAYEFKTEELFKSLGYHSDVQRIETLTPESLVSAFDKSVDNYAHAAPEINKAVERDRQQAWQVADFLMEIFPERVQTCTPGDGKLLRHRTIRQSALHGDDKTLTRPAHMRIAFLLHQFPALSETFILRQLAGLMAMGHDVRIFAEYACESGAHARTSRSTT